MVQTVTGLVAPDRLGPTMPHEHVLFDASYGFRLPEGAAERALALAPVSLENLWWLRYNYSYQNLDNRQLLDVNVAIDEVSFYKRDGGGALVDATTRGIGRDPLGLAQIARATGVPIIMAAGYYVERSYPHDLTPQSENELVKEFVRDVTDGVGDTGLRAGIFGELGCSLPWTANEQKVVRAAARAQQLTGVAITIHPGHAVHAALEILDTLKSAGARMDQVIMGHAERALASTSEHLSVLKTGCYLEFDLFGLEVSYNTFSSLDTPSDGQRLDYICRLVAEGYLERILMSQDTSSKARITRYGGLGYGHILRNLIPRMRRKGLTTTQIETLLVGNLARVLAIRAPSKDPLGKVLLPRQAVSSPQKT
ncbi:MAG: aryldialkylphosphatase [Chloroflexi bacterium]|nr:aryldialkylphosphatase [Chloroflexota bacterium]